MKQRRGSVQERAIYWLSIAIIGLITGIGLQFVQAWTNPSAMPPIGNVAGPITTGGAAQWKTGPLGINTGSAPITGFGLSVGGNAAIGNSLFAGGNISSSTQVAAPRYCIGSSCITSWPSGGDNLGNHTASSALNMNGKDINSAGVTRTGQLLTNNYGPLPNGWSGVHTWDVHARSSVRANTLCLGGGSNGDGVGDCRSVWPSGGVADNLGNHTATTDLNMNGRNILNGGNRISMGGIGSASYFYGDSTNTAARQNGGFYVQNAAGTASANIYVNNAFMGGKAYSAGTVATDAANTLTTKGYVDTKVGNGSMKLLSGTGCSTCPYGYTANPGTSTIYSCSLKSNTGAILAPGSSVNSAGIGARYWCQTNTGSLDWSFWSY